MKSACISVVGRPSSGKSSLVNRLCGHKISIVSAVPQTTRNNIRGILTGERGQLVFLDTPGFYLSEKNFNLRLQHVMKESLGDADLVLYVVDVSRPAGDEERAIRELLRPSAGRLVLALNKNDLAADQGAAALAEARAVFPAAPAAAVSALTGDGLDPLLGLLYDASPEGEAMYPPDFYTDQDPGFRIAELVREEVLNNTAEEVPHAVYVEIADLEMHDDGNELWVRGFICVERESQKGIVIGRGGEKIRKIMAAAAAAVRPLFPYRITLDFRVKVRPRWRRDDSLLKTLIH
jgi:GTP-binding protein Era